SDPELVAQAVASVLGVSEQQKRALADTLLGFLCEKELLLVLDNCEHLIDTCAHLAAQWLQHAPGLRLLATSREALNLAGEAAWVVPPLRLPELVPQSSSAELQPYDA